MEAQSEKLTLKVVKTINKEGISFCYRIRENSVAGELIGLVAASRSLTLTTDEDEEGIFADRDACKFFLGIYRETIEWPLTFRFAPADTAKEHFLKIMARAEIVKKWVASISATFSESSFEDVVYVQEKQQDAN